VLHDFIRDICSKAQPLPAFSHLSYQHLFDFAEDTMASAAVYKFFRPELRDASYATGDVYSPLKVKQAQEEWDIYK
jgi:hypothetical protein